MIGYKKVEYKTIKKFGQPISRWESKRDQQDIDHLQIIYIRMAGNG